MQSDYKELIQIYKAHLKSKGFTFYHSSNFKDISAIQLYPQGQWIVGPPGTAIFVYFQQNWPSNVKFAVIQTMYTASQYPAQISQFLHQNGFLNNGPNFTSIASNPQILIQAVQSLNFQLTSQQNQTFTNVGTASQTVAAYYQQILSPLRGNVNIIIDYLMNTMIQFQELLNSGGQVQTSAQYVCLIYPTVLMAQNYESIQQIIIVSFTAQATNQRIIKTVCHTKTEIQWGGEFLCATLGKQGSIMSSQMQQFVENKLKKNQINKKVK